VVTHDIAEWREEIPWMSLYFSAAVWASLALCVAFSLESQLPHYRTAPVAEWSAQTPAADRDAGAVRGSRIGQIRGAD
jgi:hypothetical protein